MPAPTGPTMLEVHYDLHSQNPAYGQAMPGLRVYQSETNQFIDPASVGLQIDSEAIPAHLIENGARPEHVEFLTICLFGKNHPDARHSSGHVNPHTGIMEHETGGLRAPLVYLQYDQGETAEDGLNHVLRHELDHLLTPLRVPYYRRYNALDRIRATATFFAGAVAMEGVDVVGHAMDSGASMFTPTVGILGVVGLASYVASQMTSRDGAMRFVHAIDPGERHANQHSRNNADFKPITILPQTT